jgi:hypothetical protein
MSALYKAQGVKERFASRLLGLQGSVEEIANAVRNGDEFLHMPPPSACIPPRTTPGVPPTTPQTIAEPESKSDTPDSVEGWKRVLKTLSDKSGTIKDVAVNTGLALALQAIYDSGDVGSGLAQTVTLLLQRH